MYIIHFQVGTSSKPFQHNAIITLHGEYRSQEMPIYGTKSLGVRNGTLDLHGKNFESVLMYAYDMA